MIFFCFFIYYLLLFISKYFVLFINNVSIIWFLSGKSEQFERLVQFIRRYKVQRVQMEYSISTSLVVRVGWNFGQLAVMALLEKVQRVQIELWGAVSELVCCSGVS